MHCHPLFVCLLGISSLAHAATGQYPCTNALYYARTQSGSQELLVCQTPPGAIAVLFGKVLEYTPLIDTRFNEETITVTQHGTDCDITFPLSPNPLVLHLTPENHTLHLPHLAPTTLDDTTRIEYLREWRRVKETCETH